MSNLFSLCFAFQLLIWIANCDGFSLSGKMREISSVVNNIGQLPCPVSSLGDVAMILFFKNSSVIYSYDARNEKEEPRHLTAKNDWGLRLYFRVWPNLRRLPALIIRDLQPSDAGVYRCRVDYRNSPTTNFVSRLKVIEPPTHLEIRDTSRYRPISDQQMVPASQHSDITYMGPYQEGQNLTITCTAYGGTPLPEVMWFKNGVMIDAHYDIVGDNYVTNELNIVKLGSEHTLLVCIAKSNDSRATISQTVELDVYLGVKSVDLVVPDEMTAGDEYTLICKAMGAYPTVKIEFWKMQKRIGHKFQTRSDADNVTAYNFSYNPEILDDEMTISCKAENPWLNEKPLVARKTLKIKCKSPGLQNRCQIKVMDHEWECSTLKERNQGNIIEIDTPVTILRFGQNKTTNFTEGESVLMECHVKSNTRIHSILWIHQNEQLYNNETTGVRINGMTLILTNLQPTSGGKYFCHAPKCSSESEVARIVRSGFGESHLLDCNVLAWPPDLNFYWTLNGSHNIVPILSETMINYTKGTFEEIIPSEEFDEYIYPAKGIVKNVELQMQSEDSGSGEGDESSHVPFEENRSSQQDSSILTRTIETPDGISTDHSALYESNPTEDYSKLKSQDTTNTLRLVRQERSFNNGGGGVVKGVHERGKLPQDSNGDNIRHQAILSYTIRSVEDYGEIACWGRNSFSSQIKPCIFKIIPITKEEANQDEAVGDGLTTNGNLTSQYSLEDVRAEQGESGIRDPSKLQTTLGIILMVLLIFIASFGGLLVFLLLFFAKRRKQIQRMVMTSKRRDLDSVEVASSTTEKCTLSISPRSKSSLGVMEPFYIVGKDSGILSSCGSNSSSNSCSGSCHTTTGITTITNSSTSRGPIPNKNDFPPSPTSIISTASTSHGYGSIGEDEIEEEDRGIPS